MLNALLGDVGTTALVALTLLLAIATCHYANTVAKQRADALLPLLHWQEPHGGVAVDYSRMIARTQVQIVLWNAGPGAARIRKRVATSGAISWTFHHFDEPSIIPSHEQLIVVLYTDVPVTVDENANTVRADLPNDVQVCVQFEDVVERTNYTTKPRLRFDPLPSLPLDDTPIPSEPESPRPGYIPGTGLRNADFNPDSRSPNQRKVRRDRGGC